MLEFIWKTKQFDSFWRSRFLTDAVSLKENRSQRKAETLMQRLYKGVCCYFSPRYKVKHPLMLYTGPHLTQRVHSQRDRYQHHPLHIASGRAGGLWKRARHHCDLQEGKRVSFAKPLLGTKLNASSQSKQHPNSADK